MKFIVDGMLGSLARWLRMLGYETEYNAKADDKSLLQSSQANGAILLTRDEELHHRAQAKHLESVYLEGESDEARLGQLAKALRISLEIDVATTRCPECGSHLYEISRHEASETVPAKSLELYEKFWKCTNTECGKTYWVGSHWKEIRRTLKNAKEIASDMGDR